MRFYILVPTHVDSLSVYGYSMCMIWLIQTGFVANIVRRGCGIKYRCIYDYNVYISIALIAHNPQFNSQLQKIDSSDEVPSSRGGILTSDKVWLSYWNESLSWDSVNISPGRIVNQHSYQQPPCHRFSNTALLSNMETKRRGKSAQHGNYHYLAYLLRTSNSNQSYFII